MAEQSVLPAGTAGHQDITALEDNSKDHPAAQDIESSKKDYKPLPPGRWTVPFHGNCPKCHHHHKAAQVQVKITEDPDEVSHVRCEKCQEKWAAFGGLNTTRISLLSTATTEPDSLNRAARFRLAEIVEMALEAKASLRTVTESPSPTPSRQLSETASTRAIPHAPGPSDDIVVSGPSEREVIEITQEQSKSAERTLGVDEHHERSTKKRHRTVQLFSRLKLKLTNQLSRLRRAPLKLRGSYQQPARSVRQCTQSPTRTPRILTPNVLTMEEPSSPVSTRRMPEQGTADATGSAYSDVDKSTGLFSEVATFITKLDKDELKSLDDQGQIQWMRERYTEFKYRKEPSRRCSSIAGASVGSSSAPLPNRFNRRSYEVSGTGSHIDGLREIIPFLRPHSFAMSEGVPEQSSSLDGSTVVPIAPSSVATLTQATQPEPGPQSTVVDRWSVQSRRRSRRSLQMSLHSRRGSSTSLRGHTGPRLSQGTMIYSGSMTNIPEMSSQYHGRRSSNPEPSSPRPMSS